jgi:hypothetical protein
MRTSPAMTRPIAAALVAATTMLAVLSLSVAPAAAQPSWVPTFDPERRVTVVPSGYEPPGIGEAGLARLEQALRRTHYPFHVIILLALPSGPGDEDARARSVTDTLAEVWATQGADPAVTSYFALTYEPRKFSLLVGARWKTELGLEGDALDPFIDRFIARVRGTPPDPAGGILALAEGLDGFVFDRTDPERVAKRAAASARERLQKLTSELDGLLASDPAYLPWELGPWRETALALEALGGLQDAELVATDLGPHDARVTQLREQVSAARAEAEARAARLARAREQLGELIVRVRTSAKDDHAPDDVKPWLEAATVADAALATGDTDTMEAAHLKLKQVSEPYFAELHENIAAADARRELFHLLLTIFILGLILGGPLVLIRRVKRNRLRKVFEDTATAWANKLTNAGNQYVEFYGKRDEVLGLVEMKGRTAELVNAVTTEVDAIYTVVRAMEAHVAACRDIAASAGFIDLATLRRALSTLGEPFEFDTSQLNTSDLFGPPTVRVSVNPNSVEAELAERFKKSVEGWQRLELAAEWRFKAAAELFPHTGLDGLLARLDEAGIPHGWSADHPLFGDEASDARVYESADALRWEDAVAYMEQIEALRAEETKVASRVSELIAARQRAKTAKEVHTPRGERALDPTRIALRRRDDPAAALAEARSAWAAFEGLLAAPPHLAGGLSPSAALGAANEAVKRFEGVGARADAVDEALRNAERAVKEDAPARIAAVAAEVRATKARAEAARALHADVPAVAFLGAAEGDLDEAAHALADAERHLGTRHLVNALAAARKAMAEADEGMGRAKEAGSSLDAQEAVRARVLEQIGRAEALRVARESAIRRYGESSNLSGFRVNVPSGPADYSALLHEVERVFDSWEAEERRARLAYEERERRRREAEEAARRAAAAARARARASSTSWSSSSSSSSRSSWSSSSSSSRSSWSSSSSSSRSGSWSSSSSSSSSSRSGSW